MEMVNRPYATAFEAHALANPEVLCLSADLTSSCEIDGFRDRHPDRFLSLGMAEQNMLSFAGGLGLAGFRPFLHSFGVFLYRRPYDQLMASVAYPRRKVRLMGFLPGLTTPGGMTHQAIEDIAVMRTIPNMTVLEAGDATEVESIVAEADRVDGPVYCRILRGAVPRLFATPMRLGQVRVLAEGDDVLVVTAGIATEEAMRARGALDRAGVSVRHLHLATLKPFDAATILAHAEAVRFGVVTLENHLVTGGIGSMVAEALAEAGLPRRLTRLGLQDTYAHGGSRPYLMRYYGLDALSLVRAVERLTGQQTGIDEAALGAVRLEAVHSAAKAEAL
ncbi:transketolase [Rhodobacter veldkampii DSM 11550]|uniref:Transketolase n=1 Tax=Phaeovulum veldkampii DSM 11550 TaxID=1185920 RepID=A0A2T4JI76_9RHOB|nr:transketolase C-terminal domain-containing protein [Phaeovulum veldkampii]MBK5945543.1 transketolase [Phaeovulum veldkampii DSM 11550]PTE17562.1 transketolase [Phaeovulum veldkampii DSM 11550]TDQ60272.1 transketolase [Phaeovulum veldkampii DSM 11550]